jgi:RNA polymerase sigma-70 factor (ECF subfamily)
LSIKEQDQLSDSLKDAPLPDFTESMRLAEAAKTGDRQALDDLLRRYEPRLRRIVRIRLNARLRRCLESVDIIQETYTSAFQAIERLELRSTASILQWLARIAENHMIDAYRRHYGTKRNRDREGGGDPEWGDAGKEWGAQPHQPLSPDKEVAKQEILAMVDNAVSQLPDEEREVVLLRSYHGGSWAYVAKQMGRPSEDAARQLHRRARMRLARLLDGRLPPAD